MTESLWIIEALKLTTASLVGLIWTVQLVVYPSFEFFDPAHKTHALKTHGKHISPLVMTLMVVEFGLSFWVWWNELLMGFWLDLSLVALILIWLSTGFYFVPLHFRLYRHFTLQLHRRLVWGNWFRTILWSIRLVLIYMALYL